MKALMAKEALLTSPDFNEEFEIHTNASKLQLGACISRKGKPVAFTAENYNLYKPGTPQLKEIYFQ
jgi:RNase H-like domain found in reverse transcriptase